MREENGRERERDSLPLEKSKNLKTNSKIDDGLRPPLSPNEPTFSLHLCPPNFSLQKATRRANSSLLYTLQSPHSNLRSSQPSLSISSFLSFSAKSHPNCRPKAQQKTHARDGEGECREFTVDCHASRGAGCGGAAKTTEDNAAGK